MQSTRTITLPSFLRKSLNAYALKALIRHSGAQLVRVGRSRHWKLTANNHQILQIVEKINHSSQPSWQWLATRLREHQQQLSYQELLTIAGHKPGITVQELLTMTDCSIALARKVIDDLEWSS